jgi:hypothetical protein
LAFAVDSEVGLFGVVLDAVWAKIGDFCGIAEVYALDKWRCSHLDLKSGGVIDEKLENAVHSCIY